MALPPRRTDAPTTAAQESPGSSKANPNGEHMIHGRGTKMFVWNGYFSVPRPYGMHDPCTECVSSVGLEVEAEVSTTLLL